MSRARAAVYAALVGGAVLGPAPGCSGVLGLTPGTLSDGGLGEPCWVNGGGSLTQCGDGGAGLACIANVCRTGCNADRDCAANERCVVADNGNNNNGNNGTNSGPAGPFGCVPVSALACSSPGSYGGCSPGQVCDPNGQCRTSCNNCGGSCGSSNNGGCPSDQTCVNQNGPSACYGPRDTGTDGAAGDDSSSGSDSTTPSSCAGSLMYGSCSQCGQLSNCAQCLGCVSLGGGGSCTGSPSGGDCANCGSQYGCSSCMGCTQTTGQTGCSGTPTPCSSYSGVPSYATLCANSGCTWGSATYTCSGSAAPCSAALTLNACNRAGCAWSTGSTTCTGTLAACGALGPSDCGRQFGCFWSGPTPSCAGTLTPCNQIPDSSCTTQQGCSLPPATDASVEAPEDAPADSSCATGSSDDGAVVCNCLANVGPTVTLQIVGGTSPPPTSGGTVTDGTYVLSSATLYTGPGGPSTTGPTVQMTVQFTAGTVEEVQSLGGGAPTSATATWSTSGSSFTRYDSCPTSATTYGSFAATSTSLTVEQPFFSDAGASGELVETFSRQ